MNAKDMYILAMKKRGKSSDWLKILELIEKEANDGNTCLIFYGYEDSYDQVLECEKLLIIHGYKIEFCEGHLYIHWSEI